MVQVLVAKGSSRNTPVSGGFLSRPGVVQLRPALGTGTHRLTLVLEDNSCRGSSPALKATLKCASSVVVPPQ